jgi:hypothetical protein
MAKTTAPMTLDAMQTFARRQLAHYTELVRVLDQIAHDPLSVLPQPHGGARAGAGRPARPAVTPLPKSRVRGDRVGPFARAAMAHLGVATAQEAASHARGAGWQTRSANANSVMLMELKRLCAAKVLRKVTRPGTRPARYALATPSKAAAKKLATAQAMVNNTARDAAPAVIN